MPGRGHAERRRVWQARLRRFADSGLSVAAFCRQERVSAPAFYKWRRKLGATNGRREAAVFVPVRLEPAAVVELRLPNGVVLSLPAGDAATLAAAIAAAARLPAAAGEGAAC